MDLVCGLIGIACLLPFTTQAFSGESIEFVSLPRSINASEKLAGGTIGINEGSLEWRMRILTPSKSTTHRFGEILEVVGDHDGNGCPEVAVYGSTDDDLASARESWYSFIDSVSLSEVRRIGVTGTRLRLGGAIANAGDVDGDGVDDYAMGLRGGNVSNIVAIVSSSSLCVTQVITKPTTTDGGWGTIANLGDLDGDGICELAVASAGSGITSASHGTQLLGRGEENWGSARVYSCANGLVIHERLGGSHYAERVVSAGDWDSDGRNDYVVTAGWKYSEGEWSYRGLEAFSSATGERLWLSSLPRGVASINGRIVRIGDVDADGCADVLFGLPAWRGTDVTHRGRGGALVVSGRTGMTIRKHTGDGPMSLGISAVGLCDLDGDSVAECAIAEGLLTAIGPGVIHVYSGRSGCELGQLVSSDSRAGFGFTMTFLSTEEGNHLIVGAPSASIDSGEGAIVVFSL